MNSYHVKLFAISCPLFYVMHYVPSATVAPTHYFEMICFSHGPHMSSHMIDIVDFAGWGHSNYIFDLSILVSWQMLFLFTQPSLILLYQSLLSLLSCLISWIVFFGLQVTYPMLVPPQMSLHLYC